MKYIPVVELCLPSYVNYVNGKLIRQALCNSQNCLCMHAQHSNFNLILLKLAFEILWLEPLRCTLPIADLLSGKNVRAWVSMDFK